MSSGVGGSGRLFSYLYYPLYMLLESNGIVNSNQSKTIHLVVAMHLRGCGLCCVVRGVLLCCDVLCWLKTQGCYSFSGDATQPERVKSDSKLRSTSLLVCQQSIKKKK